MTKSLFKARFLTKTEIKETLKDGAAVGYDVSKENDLWTITDPEKNTTVFRALVIEGVEVHICRINSNYFDI